MAVYDVSAVQSVARAFSEIDTREWRNKKEISTGMEGFRSIAVDTIVSVKVSQPSVCAI